MRSFFFRIKNAANYFPKWNFLSKPLKHTSSFMRSWPCTKTEIETSYYSFTDVYLPFSKILISPNGISKQRNRWMKKRSTCFWPCTSYPTRMQWWPFKYPSTVWWPIIFYMLWNAFSISKTSGDDAVHGSIGKGCGGTS